MPLLLTCQDSPDEPKFLAGVTSVSVSTDVRSPGYEGADVVVAAPGPGPGNWAGAASCVLVDGTFWLAYRVRRPLDEAAESAWW